MHNKHQTIVIDAARSLISEGGAQQLSVKRIADRAGASTQLIYTAFGGKMGIVDALYREGFSILGDALAAVPARPGHKEYIADLGRAYRATALRFPEYYDVMFHRVIPEYKPSSESRQFAFKAFDVLVTAIDTYLQKDNPKKLDPTDFAQSYWAVVHGLVALELAGYLSAERQISRFDDVINDMIKTMHS